MPYERTSRITVMVTAEEQQEIREEAARRGVSISKYVRGVGLALARGQLIPDQRLPGIDRKEFPDWLKSE